MSVGGLGVVEFLDADRNPSSDATTRRRLSATDSLDLTDTNEYVAVAVGVESPSLPPPALPPPALPPLFPFPVRRYFRYRLGTYTQINI